jgi:hypothetical protein
LRKITADKSTKETVSIQTLLVRFLKDPSIAAPPKAVPIQHSAQFYSAEYTIGELLDNPKTSALVKKYLPNIPPAGFIRAITVEQLMSFSGLGTIGDVFGLAGQLAKTPVGP